MNRQLNRLSNLFLLIMGLESLCTLFKESFSLLLPAETYFWLAVLCFFLWIASGFKRGILIGMPLSAAVLFYLYRNHTADLLAEFQDILENISSHYYGHFSGNAAAYTYSSTVSSHMVAFLFIFFLLAAFVATALTSGSFRVSLSLIATIPLFGVCIAVNGTPSVLPVLGVFLFWCGILIGGEVFRLNDGSGKAVFIALLPCLFVLAGLLLIYRPSNYTPSEADYNLSQRFDKIGNALSDWMNNENTSNPLYSEGSSATAVPLNRAPKGWNSSGEDLDLTVSFDYSEIREEAFRVSADITGSLYFRGRSYGDYTGTSWSAAVVNDHTSALSYTAQSVASGYELESSYFQLLSKKIYDVLYLPYYSISSAENDVYLSSASRNSYSGDFYYPQKNPSQLSQELVLPAVLQQEEKQYSEYAHSYYTRLPDSTRNTLSQLCTSLGFESGQDDIIARIADYVRSIGEYDVNTNPYPSEDYAVYFLTAEHRGYCIHFATAAAALYRCLQIPARVCEGYLVNIQSGQTVTVTGADAHAWVEVYQRGIGWIPVEVTASAAEYSAENSTSSVPETSNTDELSVQPSADPSTDSSVQSGLASGNTDDDQISDQNQTKPNERRMSSVLRRILTYILFVVLMTALLGIRYCMVRYIVKRRLSVSDNRKQSVNQYHQAERILRYGGEMPKILQETAEKASFSQHNIEPQELQACREALSTLTEEVYTSLSKRKKFLFRYWSGNL